jgi:hypothetical protein
MSPRPGSDARVYLTPLATLIGLGLCAAAIHRASEPGAREQAALDPMAPAAQAVLAPVEHRPTGHGLRDLFRPHLRAAAARCGLDPALVGDPDIVVAELPLSLTVASDGRVTEATPAGSGRVFGVDGAARPLDLGEDRARCYAGLVRAWVRFPGVTEAARLEAPLRVIDAQ